MLRYCLKTTYFRGRGPQRIRKVCIFETQSVQAAPVDDYLAGTGFRDGVATGGIALPSLNNMIPVPGGAPGNYNVGHLRQSTYIGRTIEPRFHPVSEIPVPGGVVGANCFLDFYAVSEATINGHNHVAIKCYHVPVTGGFMESASIAAGALPAGIYIAFELEYTMHSGAEA